MSCLRGQSVQALRPVAGPKPCCIQAQGAPSPSGCFCSRRRQPSCWCLKSLLASRSSCLRSLDPKPHICPDTPPPRHVSPAQLTRSSKNQKGQSPELCAEREPRKGVRGCHRGPRVGCRKPSLQSLSSEKHFPFCLKTASLITSFPKSG